MKQPGVLKYIAISFFLFYGCSANENKKQEESFNTSEPVIIDVTQLKETDPIRLSQFADSISYIFLSETDYVFDQNFSKIMIADDTLFLIKSDNVYKYTPEGVFIKKIIDSKQRRSPNIKYLYSAFNKKERFFTFSSSKKIVRQSMNYTQYEDYVNFSFDGVFLNETNYVIDNHYKIINSYFDDFCLYRKDTIIGIDSRGNRLEPVSTAINRLGPYLFYVENMNTGSVVYSYPNPTAENSFPYRNSDDFFPGNMNFIRIDSVLWFKHFVIDTLFSTRDFVTITPGYVFKTDKSFMNIHDYTQLKNGLLDENRVNKLKKIWGILPLPASGKLLFTVNRQIAIADNNGDTVGFSGEPVINDIDEYLKNIDITMYLGQRSFYVENDYLYLIVAANQFFKEGCKPPFENIMNDNSPVVLKIKLKT